MEIRVRITKHAKERFIERALDKLIRREAHSAFKNGKRLTEDEFRKMFENNIADINNVFSNKKFYTREFRKYGGLLYVFGERIEAKDFMQYRLITVLPYGN
jgi:hypothetical protein